MRKKARKQLPLMLTGIEHRHAEELKHMDRILSENSIINEWVLQDLQRDGVPKDTGAEGMTAEQVIRSAMIKKMEGFSYDELAFHLIDSVSYRGFCKIGIGDKGFKKSTLNTNIKKISDQTWEVINRVLLAEADSKGIEKGKESRIDCTVVESHIHAPSDSSLLWDGVRVLTRLLKRAEQACEEIRYTDHTKRAKRRLLGVMSAKGAKARKEQYRDLLKVTDWTVGYAEEAIAVLQQDSGKAPSQGIQREGLCMEIQHYLELTRKVIDQTERRVLNGQSVPPSEKVVSIFESHTDIIKKDNRDTYYGHKVCLTQGASSLITDCVILEGNPADSTLTEMMLDRQATFYGRYPNKVALDGGFASKENLEKAKEKGIKDVCFSKRCGMKIEDMCRSEYVYNKLRRFRAGIESGISFVKRCFGFARCTWKSFRSFKAYVWASIVSVNLLTLARKRMA